MFHGLGRGGVRKGVTFTWHSHTFLSARRSEYAPIREMGFNRSNLISFFSKKPQVKRRPID